MVIDVFSSVLHCLANLCFNYVTDFWCLIAFQWYAFNFTKNRVKIAYLDRHHRQYDSYIIGSLASSSVELLNAHVCPFLICLCTKLI